MRRYDTDIPRLELHQLNLPRRPAWECNQLSSQASQSQWVIARFENREFLRRVGECEYVNGVQQGDNNARLGQTDTEDGGAEFERDDRFLLCVVPNDELPYCE